MSIRESSRSLSMAFALTFVSAGSLLGSAGCELSDNQNGTHGQLGQPCRNDGTCDAGLKCEPSTTGVNTCFSVGGDAGEGGHEGGDGGHCEGTLAPVWSGNLKSHEGNVVLGFDNFESTITHAAGQGCLASITALFTTDGGCSLQVEAQSVVNDEDSARQRMLVTRIALNAEYGCAGFPQADAGNYDGRDRDIEGSWIEMDVGMIQPTGEGVVSCAQNSTLILGLKGTLTLANRGKKLHLADSRFEIRGDLRSTGAAGQCPKECISNIHCSDQRMCTAEGLCEGCEDCRSGEICIDDICVQQECEPSEYRCDGRKLYKCDADGVTEELVDTCETAMLCDAKNEMCGVCEPNEYECDDQDLRRCAQDGSRWTTVDQCREDEVCNEEEGRCDEFDCVEDEFICRDNDLWTCDNNGNLVLEQRCDDGEVCDEREEDCIDGEACEDDELFCRGDDVYECDERDNDHTHVEDCRDNDERTECHNGYCVPRLDSDDTVGGRDRDDSDYSFVVGNVFTSDDFVTLWGVDAYLDVEDEDETLEWTVYERSDANTWANYTRVAREYGRARRKGEGWYASPELDVDLRRDYSYIIAVGGTHGSQSSSGSHTKVFYDDRTSSGDHDTSFGDFVTSVSLSNNDDLGSSISRDRINQIDDPDRAYHQRLYIEH